VLWLAAFFALLLWSGIHPRDRFTWFLEVLPAILGLVVLALSYRRFRLIPLAYGLVLLLSAVLMIGGHYTYAQVPAFDWLRDLLGVHRNDYDKLAHLVQVFVPAILAREVFIRLRVINGRAWLNFLVACFCLALSAAYELVEWGVAELTGAAAEAFLGTQGYVWDTQSDMALALLGSLLALGALGRWHDRQIQGLERSVFRGGAPGRT